jgi:hypothetical protein
MIRFYPNNSAYLPMKKLTEKLKSDIKLLNLAELPMFKENKPDFSQFKDELMKKHNISDDAIKRELGKTKDK